MKDRNRHPPVRCSSSSHRDRYSSRWRPGRAHRLARRARQRSLFLALAPLFLAMRSRPASPSRRASQESLGALAPRPGCLTVSAPVATWCSHTGRSHISTGVPGDRSLVLAVAPSHRDHYSSRCGPGPPHHLGGRRRNRSLFLAMRPFRIPCWWAARAISGGNNTLVRLMRAHEGIRTPDPRITNALLYR